MDWANGNGLLVEVRDGVLTITLDSPPLNAINDELHHRLHSLFQSADADPHIRVIVLTGAGKRAFSAGGDVTLMAADLNDPRRAMWLDGMSLEKSMLQILLNLRKPLITKINGSAYGLGATLAVLGDISIMAENAKIADTHVNAGLAAGDGGALLWPLLMGFSRARRHLLTGEALTGRQAADLGLISEAVPYEQLDHRVYEVATQLASGATIAINNTKIAINLVLRRAIDSLIEAHYGLEVQSALSDDHREAIAAIQAGRKPKFTGR